MSLSLFAQVRGIGIITASRATMGVTESAATGTTEVDIMETTTHPWLPPTWNRMSTRTMTTMTRTFSRMTSIQMMTTMTIARAYLLPLKRRVSPDSTLANTEPVAATKTTEIKI